VTVPPLAHLFFSFCFGDLQRFVAVSVVSGANNTLQACGSRAGQATVFFSFRIDFAKFVLLFIFSKAPEHCRYILI
jgi:hypothetical protein